MKNINLNINWESKIIDFLIVIIGITIAFKLNTWNESITASREFRLVKEIEVKKIIVNTYNSYNTTLNLENLLSDYVNKYLIPFFIEMPSTSYTNLCR